MRKRGEGRRVEAQGEGRVLTTDEGTGWSMTISRARGMATLFFATTFFQTFFQDPLPSPRLLLFRRCRVIKVIAAIVAATYLLSLPLFHAPLPHPEELVCVNCDVI